MSENNPAVQYAFFTPEGGQWVFRGESVEEVEKHLDALLDAVDETEEPGILTTIQALKAAGVLKEGMNKAAGDSPASSNSNGNSGLPAWVLPEAERIVGRAVDPSEVKSGNYKSKPGKWYKIGDNWINQPKDRG